MAGVRKVERCRDAAGQIVLFNPQAVSAQVVVELLIRPLDWFPPIEAAGCLADVMISQRKGEFPPAAFMIISRATHELSVENIIERKDESLLPRRLQKAEKAFENIFAVAILPVPQHAELQMEIIKHAVRAKVFSVFSVSAAVKQMVAVHEKLCFTISAKAEQINVQMTESLLTCRHAMAVLQTNFPFLNADECEMLLDLFGSISAIAQAGADRIMDVTVLSSAAAHAIEEFFSSEYVVE